MPGSLVERYENVVTLNAHIVGLQGLFRRLLGDLAAGDVEARTVTLTLDLYAFQDCAVG